MTEDFELPDDDPERISPRTLARHQAARECAALILAGACSFYVKPRLDQGRVVLQWRLKAVE
jgi:hypothetical protein